MALVSSLFSVLFNTTCVVVADALEAHSKWWAWCFRFTLPGLVLVCLFFSVLFCYFRK